MVVFLRKYNHTKIKMENMENKELIIKKCQKCGAVISVMKDCENEDCKIMCCNEEMKVLVPNSVDAAVEKHVPTYEVKDGKIFITVNHVMEENHYIEWVSMIKGNKQFIQYFKPGETCQAHFKYMPGADLYAYCNLHSLWTAKVD